MLGKRIIGVTGGRTLFALPEVGRQYIIDNARSVHHGCCIGADEKVVVLCAAQGIHLVAHPPFDQAWMMISWKGDVIREPKQYLERNHDIVDETEELVAFPSGPEILRSGTWATVRYAVRQGKPVCIIYQDDTIEYR